MKEIAAAAGVSIMTVSYALRGHSSIPSSTRQRIRRIADEMGYHRHPYLSALMTQVRARKMDANRPVIAYLCGTANRSTMMANYFRRQFFTGAASRAEALGFSLEPIFTEGVLEGRGRRISSVLKYRRIDAVIMSVHPLKAAALDLNWADFACCVLGYSRSYPMLHRVDSNHSQLLRGALDELARRGYHRPGYLCSVFENRRAEGAVCTAMAGYNQTAPPRERLPFHIISPNRWNPGYVNRWVRQHQVDALIVHSPQLVEFLQQGNPALPVVTLEATEDNPLPGMDPRPQVIGAMAVDQVIHQLNHQEYGTPHYRTTTLVDGIWRGELA